MIEDVSLQLVPALAVLVALRLDLFELAEQIALLELHLEGLVLPSSFSTNGLSEVFAGAHLAVVEQLDTISFQKLPVLLSLSRQLLSSLLRKAERVLQGVLGLFLGGLHLDLRESELLLQLKVLDFDGLVLAVRLALLQLNLLHEELFTFELGHGLGDLVGHEFDLIPHCMVADLQCLLQGSPAHVRRLVLLLIYCHGRSVASALHNTML